ncbi:sugar phosphate isomerase/epimerase family protein [Campylobacter molothri]|uniref:TIM barrel protein n=1 Tax=Campylobacter molothri TaxID=1032242 RepID=A0ACC5W2Z3_9BACT|nr:TIM barrel protein [Campylobacter sp. RM10537]MBZ7928668.1 TIM barrel protein [Campylobacter sp. RM10542]MBZ7949852.1 TIM barrel protein [Campylobacter sp. RM10534]MBZ7958549.1 TIM barrel protein [Campylobacter sp. RM9760]MBZ7970469.1 TIM barrel protein [Campylobacter sp. RM3125]MBZ7971955.1 TIM barrel protein [Campylobacter sp. RM3124]MBZ7974803.1 TIM barrel protein [Campylobacter sp. RM9754]
MKIGLETESMHLWFQNGKMDIFSYIDFAKELDCDGVIINIIKDFGLDEEWGCLGSNEEHHLKKIRAKLDEYNMYCEIDAKGFDKNKFEKIAKVAQILNTKIIRSYVPLTDKSKKVKNASDGSFDDSKITALFNKEEFLNSSNEIKALIEILENYDLKLAIENHEYQTSSDLLELLALINHPRVGFLYDFGNSMMAYEDPIKACKDMAKYTFSTHCKDHIIFNEDGVDYVCGVPLGEGNIDIKACIEILKNEGLDRINIEQCYPYCANFKREKGTGGVDKLGEGAFKIEKPLFKGLKAMQYYYPQEVSNEHLEKLLRLQKEGCKKSVKYLKSII